MSASLQMTFLKRKIFISLQWRHNRRDGVSNLRPHHCLFNRLFGRTSKRTSKLRVTGLCAGNSPVTGEFPAQMASDGENVSIWWRHHVCFPLHGNLFLRVLSRSQYWSMWMLGVVKQPYINSLTNICRSMAPLDQSELLPLFNSKFSIYGFSCELLIYSDLLSMTKTFVTTAINSVMCKASCGTENVVANELSMLALYHSIYLTVSITNLHFGTVTS